MKCTKCGEELQKNANFCPICGTPVEREAINPDSEAGQPKEPTPSELCETGLTANPAAPAQTFGCGFPFPEESVSVRLKTGFTILGITTTGKLAVSDSGVSYTVSFSMSSQSVNHSYGFDSIRSTEFKMVLAGLQPLMAYVVSLKTGQEYVYVYDILRKTPLQRLDGIIRSKMS